MEIIRTSGNLTKAESYHLTHAPETKKVADMTGECIDLKAWALFKDEDEDGIKDVLTILDVDGVVYGTVSPTFIGTFTDMVDYFAPDPVNVIKVLSGTTKNGREYVNCDYVS